MQHPHAELVGAEQHGSHHPDAGSPPASHRGEGDALPTAALDYHLPAERIATHPAEPRDSARMLVVRRGVDATIEHRNVRDLPEYLRSGDALVFNNTAVAPARLELRRATGGRVEGLFLEEKRQNVETSKRQNETALAWQVMLRSGGRIGVGERLTLLDHDDRPTDLVLRVVEHRDDQWTVELERGTTPVSTAAVLDRVGRTPLPPYILKARHEHHETYRDADDQRWYQTVYADAQRRQSVAAPTAGLHFTPDLLKRIEAMGVKRIDITLHVGPGTFKPVTAATLGEHRMHSEWYEVRAESLAALRDVRKHRAAVSSSHPHPRSLCLAQTAKERGGSIIAVGTTSVRTLESLPADALVSSDSCGGFRGSTDLLIAPAPQHAFRHVDGLLTNFHLPRSTLLALVAAMLGLDRLLQVYREAIDRGYRFYSYGDAMLILP